MQSTVDLTPNASPSHDSHVTSPGQFPIPSQPYYKYNPRGSSSLKNKIDTNLDLSQSENESDSTRKEDSSTHSADTSRLHNGRYTEFYPHTAVALTDFHLHPPLPSVEPLSVNETSDVLAGTSQAYRNNYYPLSHSYQLPGNSTQMPGNTERDHHTEISSNPPGVPNGVSQFMQAKNDEKTISGSPMSRPEIPSNYGNGAYGESNVILSTGHAQTGSEHYQADSVTNGYHAGHTQSQYDLPTEHAQSQYDYSTEHAQNVHPHYSIAAPQDDNQDVIQSFPQSHLGVGQLEVLYDARGRQINELSQQLVAKTDDAERHVRILRHEKVWHQLLYILMCKVCGQLLNG